MFLIKLGPFFVLVSLVTIMCAGAPLEDHVVDNKTASYEPDAIFSQDLVPIEMNELSMSSLIAGNCTDLTKLS